MTSGHPQAERVAAEARRGNKRLDPSAPQLPAVASSGWFGSVVDRRERFSAMRLEMLPVALRRFQNSLGDLVVICVFQLHRPDLVTIEIQDRRLWKGQQDWRMCGNDELT